MKYYNDITEVVGNTPIIKLNSLTSEKGPLILAKAEFLNPGGSVKDRIALKMLENAEKMGLIETGGTIIEPTSGNTGIGLAIACILRGYNKIFIMPDKMSKEKELLLRAFGSEVIWTPTAVTPDDPTSYYKVAEKKVNEIQGSFSPNQYFNLCNTQAHYESTGPEIWRDTDGKITHFVGGLGTGGTITGTARYLKEKNPEIKIIGVDPIGSIYYSKFYGVEEEIHTYRTEGIGEDFIPKTIDLDLIDEIVQVKDKDAFQMTRYLATHEGLLVGGSSGAAVFAVKKMAPDFSNDDIVVVLLPDTGRNYLHTIFDDTWMIRHGFMEEN
ncbi:MAG: PLP-dependent cysteine synthase family protein [Candidatus Hodarchaeales archaeon]|jgi:cystathionine beta-synthase